MRPRSRRLASVSDVACGTAKAAAKAGGVDSVGASVAVGAASVAAAAVEGRLLPPNRRTT
jgi:hypothetical protein